MRKVYDELKKMKIGQIIKKPSFKNYTTYKLKGNAFLLVIPNNIDKLKTLLTYLRNNKIKYKIIGNGSNLIFKDEYYDGVLIKLDSFDGLKINDNIVKVGASYSLMKLAIKVSRLGLSGLEFATGIPGTIGGSIYMNAGAYKKDMSHIVSEIKVLTPNMEIKTLYSNELDFSYRMSFFQKEKDYVCLEATIILEKGNKDAIKKIIEDRKNKRLMTQPLDLPSAGSVFRNPDEIPAGKIIEDLGFKGYHIGDAYVSEKHANFIVNKGEAKGSDIVKLINIIKNKVKEEMGIDLKSEQEIVE